VFLTKRTQEGPAESKLKEESAVKEKKSDLERKDERKGEVYREPQRAEEGVSPKTGFDTDIRAYICWFSYVSYGTARGGREDRAAIRMRAIHKKASVMNMVKGEMKMPSRKASRNKGKVKRERS